MIKKILIFAALPILSAVVVFLVASGSIDFRRFDLGALKYYLPFGSTNTITITNQGFSPKSIEVKDGTTITFINKDNMPHQPASNLHPTHLNYPEFDSKEGIAPGKVWKFKIDKTGTWFFHDHLFPNFGGKIKVVSLYSEVNNPSSWTKEQGRILMQQIEKNENDPQRLTITRVLAHKVGPKVAIELLNESPITKFGETHLVAHVIGEVAYELYGEKALPVCQNDDLNGCSHGVILTAISDVGFEGVKAMIKYCSTLSVFKNQMCLHAAGHAFTAENNYDIYTAIKMCTQLGDYKEQDIEHCYIGAFMENVLGDHNGLTPPQHPYLSEKDPLLPCNQFEEKYQSSCYLNQATWWYRVNKGDIKKTAQNCNLLPETYQSECADNIGRIISTATKNNLELIKTQCAYMGTKLSNDCITSIAKSVFALGDEKLPFELCSNVSINGKNDCYKDVYSLMKINNLSADKLNSLCQKFEKPYQNICNSGE